MYELKRQEFDRVKPLIKTGYDHPEIVSIIEQNNPGWIFVDHTLECQVALVWSQGIQGFYLIGHENKYDSSIHIDEYITSHIAPRMRSMGLSYFEISGGSDKWNLTDLFSKREISKWGQYVYKYNHREQITETSIDGYRMIPLALDDSILENLNNKELVIDSINLFWDSLDDFRSKGLGYIALYGNDIVGVCYTSFITNDTQAIGIETKFEHQRKGIGHQLAARVVNEIINIGCIPY